jgi:hypothetical protein
MGAIAECLNENQGRAVPEHSDAKRMRALTLVADRKVELIELNAPPTPGAGIGSFGASMRNIRDGLAKKARGMLPVIDTEVELAEL